MKKLKYGNAICYSGYREGQGPHIGVYPSYGEILEDLKILENGWNYIRLYDPSEHAKTTLKVIKDNKLSLKVMLGIDLRGEVDNPNCSWGGRYSEEEIKNNTMYNEESVKKAIVLAKKYPEIIVAVSAGNEAIPDWNENLVRPEKVLKYVRALKANVEQPVTYCDGVDIWRDRLDEVAKEVDIISIHSYPAWNNYSVDDSLRVVDMDFNEIQAKYPDKHCIITETGWPSKSDGGNMKIEYVGEDQQAKCYKEIINWSKENEIIVFFFEAFDEPWKGGTNPDEPEKNWGLFDVHRLPKKALK